MGNILQLLVIGGGFLWWVTDFRTKFALISHNYERFATQLEKVSSELNELSKLTIQIARQDERMLAMEARIREITSRLDEHITKHTARSRGMSK